MSNRPSPKIESLFDLGFQDGSDADDDPPELHFRSRVFEYQLGFIVGRSFSKAVKQANHRALAETAGRLGTRYRVDEDALLTALGLPETLKNIIRQAYSQGLR
ncbi:hypothetical protein [Paraburkholderia tropica]|uniref:hypothetical protein n=1 Tax=Paraburkholderia tropica TaxID=92647 RepID=UPI002AB26C6A|nr:hypothetical protein [Paraburkholderia tropica]